MTILDNTSPGSYNELFDQDTLDNVPGLQVSISERQDMAEQSLSLKELGVSKHN